MDAGQRLLEYLLQRRSLQALIVVLFTALTVTVVVPLLILRLLRAEWGLALVDAVLVVVAAGGGLYAWFGRRPDLAAAALAVVFLLVAVGIVHVFGTVHLVWMFPVSAAMYFLLRPQYAAAGNIAALAAVVPALDGLGPGGEFAGFVAALLATNALALAFAVTMSGSRRQFRTLAERDALTGAGNRRALDAALRNAIARRAELGTPVSLIVFDIDHFKRVNDRHGHDTGDQALIDLTRMIREAVRAGDDVFRYGGEEIVVIAYGAPAAPARDLADAIRQRIAEAEVVPRESVTVSAGVAEAAPEDSREQWFRRADRLLYAAKRAGRNRVCCEAGGPPGTAAAVGDAAGSR